jgi:hypothetical protein
MVAPTWLARSMISRPAISIVAPSPVTLVVLAPAGLILTDIDVGHAAKAHRFARVKPSLAKILRLNVADVQKTIAAHAEIDESRLNARLQIDDAAFINIADVVVLTRPFDIQLF